MSRSALMAALSGVKGWLAPDEAWSLHRAAAALPAQGPIRVVEIGSWKGRSTIALALGVRTRPAGGVVHAIDPHRGGAVHRFMHAEDTFDDFVTNIKRAGLADVVDPIRATSEVARARIPDRSVHLLFVDGSHEYRDVMRDVSLWRDSLAPGAKVAFHDCTAAGVAATLRERALVSGSPFRRPTRVGELMCFDYRPGDRWTRLDSLRARTMHVRLAGRRAGLAARRRLRQLARRAEVPLDEWG
jgi:predicted O-methyltransferase YrrM